MKPLLFGASKYTHQKRTLTESADAHGEASETYTANGLVTVKIYPTNKTQTNAPEGVNVNDLYTGISDAMTLNLKDYLTNGTDAYLIVGIRSFDGSVQMDLWKDGRYYG